MKRFLSGCAALFLLSSGAANAATFEIFCVTPADCDNDTGLELTFELANEVVVANGSYDTRTDGGLGLLGLTAGSGIGAGFSFMGDLSNVSDASEGLTFNFDAFGILSGILDNENLGTRFDITSDGTTNNGVDGITFAEPNVIQLRVSSFGETDQVTDTNRIVVSWVRTDSLLAVPLPAGLPLVLTGLAGLAGLRLRRKPLTSE